MMHSFIARITLVESTLGSLWHSFSSFQVSISTIILKHHTPYGPALRAGSGYASLIPYFTHKCAIYDYTDCKTS